MAQPTPLLLDPGTSITCPRCDHTFPLSDGFARQALDSVETASSAAMAEIRAQERERQQREARHAAQEREAAHARALAETRRLEAEAFNAQLQVMRKQLEDSQAHNQLLQQREAQIAAREKSVESRIAQAAAEKAAELVAAERRALAEQLQERDKALAESRATELQLRKDKAALADRAAAMDIELARKLDAARIEIESRARAQEREKASLTEAELRKTIDDVNSKLAEAQQKAEQGSQQLQGEVLELAIEESLRRTFHMDRIEEVKKGQRGGDVLQRVIARGGQEAGLILWETKRAKDWSAQWIPKLKEDMRAAGAAVGILVTVPGALPKDWPPGALFGIYDDVWVSQATTAVNVAEALRTGLLEVHKQRLLSAGKGEKMEALFDYLTSPQFAQKLKAVYETFAKMREELESERNTTQQRWARREKQLQAGASQLLSIGGEIQGLAQQDLPMLELEPQTPT